MRTVLILVFGLFGAMFAVGAEKAGYDSRGRLIALLSDGGEVEVYSNYIAVLPSGRRVPLVERRVSGGPRSQAQDRSWFGLYDLPDGGRVRLAWKTQDETAALRYTTEVTPEGADVAGVDFVLDLPRDVFVNGRVTPVGGRDVALTARKPGETALFSGQTAGLRFENQDGSVSIAVSFEAARQVSVVDRWDLLGVSHTMSNMPLAEGGQSGTMYYNRTRRSYQIRIPVVGGAGPGGNGSLSATLALVNDTKGTPVHLSVDTSKTRYSFDGFGGNFCWNNDRSNKALQAIPHFLLKNLKHGWARTEMKIQQWDRERDNPGPDLRFDFEIMQQLEKMDVPYVISIWRLPERFYLNAWETPRGARFRQVDPAKWDELNELVGSYLLHAKNQYGVEPDLFCFNEPNLGVNVGFTPQGHTEQIKRMGAAFQKMGLKTRQVLGDVVPARDTIVFALDAAADPDAMQYVGAVAFHSWGGATPQQYAAWGDLAEWLNLPLLVTELGVDSAAYETNVWDTFHYGLREAQFTQEMLQHARPQGTQFWQYTDDYALVRLRADGSVEPTARFWLTKHFTDLTPLKSQALPTTSDQPGVLVTAFKKDGSYAVHILNRGPQQEATVTGLPQGAFEVTQSTESKQYSKTVTRGSAAELRVSLPANSLVTLTQGATR